MIIIMAHIALWVENIPMKKIYPATLLFIASLVVLPVLAQHLTAAAATKGPYDFMVRGVFRDLVQKRDFGPKASFSEALASGATEGVGALSGLRGEVTIVEGRAVVSCGSKATCADAERESAALLATAKVRVWAEGIPLPRGIGAAELGNFIDSQARKLGLSLAEPFPLRIVGALADVRMHVVSSPNPEFAGHGSGKPMAIQDEVSATELTNGEIVGVRVHQALQGVATHPGEAFHFHWVDAARTRTAHLDGFGVKAGALLLLPLR
jgi:Alpha-acetolactate decarboxylase